MTTEPTHPDPVTDLVLEGAVLPMAKAGYRFARIAGTSAGAMAGVVLAALQRAGEPVDVLGEIAMTLDHSAGLTRSDRVSPHRVAHVTADGLALLSRETTPQPASRRSDSCLVPDGPQNHVGGSFSEFGR